MVVMNFKWNLVSMTMWFFAYLSVCFWGADCLVKAGEKWWRMRHKQGYVLICLPSAVCVLYKEIYYNYGSLCLCCILPSLLSCTLPLSPILSPSHFLILFFLPFSSSCVSNFSSIFFELPLIFNALFYSISITNLSCRYWLIFPFFNW